MSRIFYCLSLVFLLTINSCNNSHSIKKNHYSPKCSDSCNTTYVMNIKDSFGTQINAFDILFPLPIQYYRIDTNVTFLGNSADGPVISFIIIDSTDSLTEIRFSRQFQRDANVALKEFDKRISGFLIRYNYKGMSKSIYNLDTLKSRNDVKGLSYFEFDSCQADFKKWHLSILCNSGQYSIEIIEKVESKKFQDYYSFLKTVWFNQCRFPRIPKIHEDSVLKVIRRGQATE